MDSSIAILITLFFHQFADWDIDEQTWNVGIPLPYSASVIVPNDVPMSDVIVALHDALEANGVDYNSMAYHQQHLSVLGLTLATVTA